MQNSGAVNFKVLKRELRNLTKIDKMEKEMLDVKVENSRVSNKLNLLENEWTKNCATITTIIIGLPEKVKKLENNNYEDLNDRPMANGDTFSFDNLSKRCGTLESEMLAMITSKGTRFNMFQEVVIRSLGEMKDWIQK